MLHALRLRFRYDRVNMKCLGNFHVPIQSWQCDNIPKGFFLNTLCIMLTSACYRRCIHAFRPHISMQIFTHNPIPSKRIRSSLTFCCSIILCVVNSSLQKQREKNVMRVWHTIICREMQCHMQETRIYWEMWYLCVWHIRIRTNKTDVKFYQLAAIVMNCC